MRRITRRKAKFRKPRFSKALAALQEHLLREAESIFDESRALDTDVRDTLADGLARLVYVAYDCEALNNISPSQPSMRFNAHREWATEKWFKDRGFADWYAKGAATLFHTMRLPSFRMIEVHHYPRKKKKAVV